jgi:DNA-binding beta-propeller fold protein YncE
MPTFRTILRVALATTALGSVLTVRTASQTPAKPAYHVIKRVAVGGEGGWDYLTVDTATHRLYVSRGSHVMVLDTDRDSIIGDIPHTPGVHGVALVPELGRGFTSNGRDASVSIFDLETLEVRGRVTVTGGNPDAILYEPTSRRVFTFNGRGENATALDPSTGAVLGTLRLGGNPEYATADGTGRVYVNIEDKSEIVAFDARTLAVQAHWPLAPCEEPTGMAIDRARQRLFVGCSNKLMAIVDAKSGRVVTTLPIGAGVDGTAYDPQTQLAFSSNGEGTITVVREESPTQRGARTIALDERTHKMYTATARFGAAPPSTSDNPHPRPPMIPGTFTLIVLGR